MRNKILILLVGLSVLVACGKKETSVIRIGAILPMTGDEAEWGKKAQAGIDLALQDFNTENPLIHVEVSVQDTKADPKLAYTAAVFLINSDRVISIIGDMTSRNTLAAAPVCDSNQVVLITPVASSPLISTAGEYVYRIYPSDDYEAKVVAGWMISHRLKRAVTVFVNDDYGAALDSRFKEEFQSLGGTLASEVAYQPGTQDFRTYILKLKGKQYDAIYLISFYKDGAVFLRQKLELGNRKPVVGAAALYEKQLIDLAGISAEGLVIPHKIGFNPMSPDTMTVRFVNEYETRFRDKPDFVVAQAYDAANVILHAILHGARTGKEVKTVLDSQEYGKGITGNIAFDSNGDLKSSEFEFLRVHDGAFVTEPK
jgi:branched-chain amino acid transport system substrate-binding protein